MGWTEPHWLSPEQVVTGDLDGNGIDDIIGDFGAIYGVWIRMNNTTWVQLHGLSPTHMAVGDLDNEVATTSCSTSPTAESGFG